MDLVEKLKEKTERNKKKPGQPTSKIAAFNEVEGSLQRSSNQLRFNRVPVEVL